MTDSDKRPKPGQFDLQQVALIMFACAVTAAVAGFAVRNAAANKPSFWIVAAAAAPVLITVAVRVLLELIRRVPRKSNRK